MVRPMVYVGLPENFQVLARYGVGTSDYGSILMAVCVSMKVEHKALMGRSRSRYLVEARQICFYLMRELTGLTLKQIGELFNRDHSTVIHGVETCKNLMQVDVPFQKKVFQVKCLL